MCFYSKQKVFQYILILQHPTYSPGLDPCDFFSIVNIKTDIERECHRPENAQVECFPKSYFLNGLKVLTSG